VSAVLNFERSHLSDQALLRDLASHLARERSDSAVTLADLAEVDERKLYLPAGFPSMYAFCVGELHLCEQAAYKRIAAARAARRFPAIFAALAEGRLHLSAIVLMAPHLTEGNAEALLAAATHRSKAQIERLLAERFPRPDLMSWVAALPASPPRPPASPPAPDTAREAQGPCSGEVACQLSPGIVGPASAGPRPTVKPLAPERFALQVTIGQGTHDKLRRAQALLGHQVSSGDVAKVLDLALDALIGKLEARKFAATDRTRVGTRRPAADSRDIPAEVKRAVRRRDGDRCTFVSENGHRCEARTRLEFDHVEPYARGGDATVSGIRPRCRARVWGRAHAPQAAGCGGGAGDGSRGRCGRALMPRRSPCDPGS
jgi:hypothetical protein